MNENDKIYTADNETVTKYKSFGAGAQSAPPTAPQQPVTAQQRFNASTINPSRGFYQYQNTAQQNVPQPGVPQQDAPWQNVAPQYVVPQPIMQPQAAPQAPQYAPPQGQYVPPAQPQYQNPYVIPSGQPYRNNPTPYTNIPYAQNQNVPPQYGYQPNYNQPATGNFTPTAGGAQYTPNKQPIYAKPPVYNQPPVQTAPVKQVDPEAQQRKASIKTLANASTVPLLIYQVGGALLVTLISSFVLAFLGDVKGTQLLADPDLSYLLNGVLSILFLTLPMLITAAWTKQPLSETVAFRKFKPTVGIAITMLGFGAIAIAQYSGSMITNYFSQIFDKPINNPISNFGTEPWSIFISLLCVAIIPAFMEEFAFRGVLLGTARKYMSDGLSIMLNAALFSLLHGNLQQIPFAFALGLYLAYATVYTNSIWPAIIIHGVNNALAVLMSYAQNATSSDLMAMILGGAYYLVMLLVGLCGLIFLIKTTGTEPTFKLSKERSEHTKQNFGWFISSPWMIIFVVIMVINTIVSLVMG